MVVGLWVVGEVKRGHIKTYTYITLTLHERSKETETILHTACILIMVSLFGITGFNV